MENTDKKFELMDSSQRALALKNESSPFLNVAKFEQMQRVASMLSKTDFIPSRFKGNVGNCMIALDMATIMNMHPLMLMRTMYVVHGQPGFEGKFVSALINNSGRYTDPLEYEWAGKKGQAEWGCRAYATRKSTGKKIFGPWVTWEMVQKEGWSKPKGTAPNNIQISKWMTMPEIMFMYRSATFFGRVHDSDLLMGMKTVDELQDLQTDLHIQSDGSFSIEEPEKASRTITDYEPTRTAPDSGPAEERPVEPATGVEVDDYGMPLDSPLEKSKWFSMRQGSIKDDTGFAAFLERHKKELPKLTKAAFEAMQAKHLKLYGSELPFNLDFEQAPAESNPMESDLLEEQIAKQLSDAAENFPNIYLKVTDNQQPKSIDQALDWLDKINQLIIDDKTSKVNESTDNKDNSGKW